MLPLKSNFLFLLLFYFFCFTGKSNGKFSNIDLPSVARNNPKLILNDSNVANYLFDIKKDFSVYNFNSQSYHFFKNQTSKNKEKTSTSENTRLEAKTVFEKIEDSGNWISTFSGSNNEVILPAGIREVVDEVEYQIAFAEARFGLSTLFKVFVKVVLPQSNLNGQPIELFFGADNIQLSKEGGLIGNGGTAGNANLVLLGNVEIPFHSSNWLLSLKGTSNYINGNIQNVSFVSIDCNGVTGMSIDGQVQISRNLLIPIQSNGEPSQDATEKVNGAFIANAASWNDLIVDVELSPFVLVNKEDKFTFTSNQAVFDFSDSRNPENITFPQHYLDLGVLLPNKHTWRGIFIKSLQVGLPKVFKTKQSIQNNDRVYFDATNLIIDNHGVSGIVVEEDVISISDGVTSEPIGWPMSVANISLELLNNNILESKFSGGMRLPIFEDIKNGTNGVIHASYNDENGILPDQNDISFLEYDGFISDEEYSIKVKTLSEIDIPVFLASIKLRAGSYIKMPVVDNNFRPETNFNGIMTTIISSKKQREAAENATQSYTTDQGVTEDETDMVRFKGLTFEGLKMKTEGATLDIEYLGYTEGLAMGNGSNIKERYSSDDSDRNDQTGRLDPEKKSRLNISLDAITYKSYPEKNEKVLGFDVSMDFTGGDEKKFIRGSTSIDVIAKDEITNGVSSIAYKDTRWAKIAVKGRWTFLKLKAFVKRTYGDSIYGNAFAGDGEIKIDFTDSKRKKTEQNYEEDNSNTNLRIKSKVLFAEDASFWYVDFSAEFPQKLFNKSTVTLPKGAFSVNGFGGGIYNNMRRRMDAGNASSKVSPSGFSYEPAMGHFGIKFIVFWHHGGDNLMRCGAGAELNINKNGGINSLSFIGQARGLNKLDNPNMFLKNQLSKQLKAYEGEGENRTLGNATDNNGRDERGIHNNATNNEVRDTRSLSERISEEEAGTDVTEIQSMPDVDGVDAYLFGQLDFENKAFYTYLDVYTDIADGLIIGKGRAKKAVEGIIQINQERWFAHFGNPLNRMGLSSGYGDFRLDYSGYVMLGQNLPKAIPPPYRVLNILGDKLRVLEEQQNKYKDQLAAGTGAAFGLAYEFDTGNLVLGPLYARFTAGLGIDVLLKKYDNQMSCNGISPIGSDGFYATGQAYAFMQGELGIGVSVFGDYRRFPIIEGGGAFLGKFGGPNPNWFQARFAANYSVLGGLIRGRINEDITIGQVCNPVPDNALGVELISSVSPTDNDDNVDVFTSPQLALSMEANTAIEIPDVNSETKTYKIKVKTFTVKDANNVNIQGKLSWNTMNTKITFESLDILPPNQELTIEIEVALQEKTDGVFRTYKVNGEEYLETRLLKFTTGDAPSYIPLSNVQYSYPVVDQKLFYRNEHPTGYLKLKKGQDYLFENSQWQTSVKYLDIIANDSEETSIQYNNASNELSYAIPRVNKKTEYTIKMVSKPVAVQSTGESVAENNDVVNIDNNSESTFTIKNNRAENQVREDAEVERLTYNFSSSSYNTFRNKMQSIKVDKNFIGKVYVDAIYLGSTIEQHDEGFDLIELEGNNYSENKPLIVASATLEDEYFKQDIAPLLYNNYPIAGKYDFNRDTNVLGVAPSKAISVRTNYLASISNDTDEDWRLKSFPFKYMLPKVYRDDFETVMINISNDYHNNIDVEAKALQFLDNRFGFIREGKYKTRFSYILPGGIKKTYALFEFNY
ncbi:hypothetical protein [uncultured Aquimarina sp.]|uniref:hypothetical protein n=1 Tax=uncultured Aquimarina sp. TaxID=575652 RepID=UPI0026140835|nr:hypothetical protein [uncultured Aquimarina sp.]